MPTPTIIRYRLLAGFCFATLLSFGQKTELRLNVYGGLSSFRGSGSTSLATGGLNFYALYGRRPTFSNSYELQVQHITPMKQLFGAAIALEKLRSRVATQIIQTDDTPGVPAIAPFTGQTNLSNSFVTLTPFAGRRFFDGPVKIDFTAGIDIAYCTKSIARTKTDRYDLHDSYRFGKNEIAPYVDWRPRLQISADFKNMTLLAGYSLGVTKYRLNKSGYEERPETKAYSGYLRFGIGYRLLHSR